MNITETLSKTLSEGDFTLLTTRIEHDPERLHELVSLFLSAEPHLVQKASWVMMNLTGRAPALLEKYMNTLMAELKSEKTSGTVKRNIVRLMQQVSLPEAIHADLLDTCFRFLSDRNEAIAVKAFSMTVLRRLAEIYPEISTELKLVIEDGLRQNPSPGYRSRGLKTLRSLQ